MSTDWYVPVFNPQASSHSFFYLIAQFTAFIQQEDSILLWKSIVSNPLLARTNLVLFLNKIDILKSKLASGIQFGHYIVSYGARPNDYDNASACK